MGKNDLSPKSFLVFLVFTTSRRNDRSKKVLIGPGKIKLFDWTEKCSYCSADQSATTVRIVSVSLRNIPEIGDLAKFYCRCEHLR